jgi:anti-sigma B factor antagonist
MVWRTEVATLRVTVEESAAGQLVVALDGELDLATVPEVIGAVTRVLASGQVSELVVDVDRLEFLDSSGVHALVQVCQAARLQGATFTVRRPRPLVARVLSVAGVSELLGVSAVSR